MVTRRRLLSYCVVRIAYLNVRVQSYAIRNTQYPESERSPIRDSLEASEGKTASPARQEIQAHESALLGALERGCIEHLQDEGAKQIHARAHARAYDRHPSVRITVPDEGRCVLGGPRHTRIGEHGNLSGEVREGEKTVALRAQEREADLG